MTVKGLKLCACIKDLPLQVYMKVREYQVIMLNVLGEMLYTEEDIPKVLRQRSTATFVIRLGDPPVGCSETAHVRFDGCRWKDIDR